MNADMEKYYIVNKSYLLRMGIWPYQHKALKILLPCFLSAVQYSACVTEVFLLQENWGNIDIMIECIINVTPLIGSNAKLINLIVNNDKFQRLLQFMNDHWVLFNSESERYILRHYAEIGRKMTKYYAAYCYTILVLYLLIPLIPRFLDIVIPLNESRPLKYIYEAEYKVDKEKYYYLILLHTFMSSISTITIILAIDTTYIICVLHTCSLFTAISHRLENIVGKTDAEIYNDEKPHTGMHYHLLIEKHDSVNDDYHELMACLKKHQLAIEHVHILDSTFTYVTFVLLIINILIMSIIGLQLINRLGQTGEIVRYSCITVGVIIHLVCMCFPGQLLMDQSAEVFDKACSSQWYTFSVKSKRLLSILLYKSLAPCTLSAGKLFVMSMTLCSSVMHTAMSYFTTFLSMK